MNARKSLIWWIVYLAWFGGSFWAFAHGAQQEDWRLKLAWVGGSLVSLCLAVFSAIRLNRAK